MTQLLSDAGRKDKTRVILHATNVHQGGGATLLKDLLTAPNGPALVFLDARMALPAQVAPGLEVIRVEPSLRGRWNAETALSRACRPQDIVLCFGNLPPLLPCSGKVYVYLQNRYLLASRPLAGLPLRAQARIRLERWWLRRCLRDATLVVQTESMAQEVRSNLQHKCQILPFAPGAATLEGLCLPLHDFIYVASGEPHKNHRCLLEAWMILAQMDIRPSLCLTLDECTDARLLGWIRDQQAIAGLKIHNHKSEPEGMPALYRQSRALIFPSLFESFGLPLIEARDAGLPILASERDYVRDVIEPEITFDPSSSLSVARAVMRHLGQSKRPARMPDATEFWQQLRGLS